MLREHLKQWKIADTGEGAVLTDWCAEDWVVPLSWRHQMCQSGKEPDNEAWSLSVSLCLCVSFSVSVCLSLRSLCPCGLTFRWWGCCGCPWHNRAYPFLFTLFWSVCVFGLFNCISFHKFSRLFSAFSICSTGPICSLLALWTVDLFMKVSENVLFFKMNLRQVWFCRF